MMYYDREADIVYVALDDGEIARSVEHDWGLLDVDETGRTLGAEYWRASEQLPAELLSALPPPEVPRTPVPKSAA
jgi:uncharacterized protein YuzE